MLQWTIQPNNNSDDSAEAKKQAEGQNTAATPTPSAAPDAAVATAAPSLAPPVPMQVDAPATAMEPIEPPPPPPVVELSADEIRRKRLEKFNGRHIAELS